MTAIGVVQIDTIPRTQEAIRPLRRSVRFRLMLQSGAFTDENQKKAYGNIDDEDEQTNILLQALVAYDARKGQAPPAAVAAPVAPTPVAAAAMPAAAPIPAMPAAAPAAPAPAPAAPMQQMPMPGMMTTPAAPAAPMPAPMPAPAPAAPAPAMQAPAPVPMPPTASMPMPVGPLPGMPASMGAPATPASAPAPAPAPAAPPAPAPVAPAPQPAREPDNGPTTASVAGEDLSTVLANQGKIAESLEHLATSIDALITGINALQSNTAGTSIKLDMALVMLLTFIENKQQVPKEQLIAYWKQNLDTGVLTNFLQQMMATEGKAPDPGLS